ncbi:MAG: transcription antitermination factor NusB [Desulfobacterales bacterium]
MEQFSSNWKISRMGCVDRNILRIAAYELLFARIFRPRFPSMKRWTSANSTARKNPAFINGILDSLYQHQGPDIKK